MNLIEAAQATSKRRHDGEDTPFKGMNPCIAENPAHILDQELFKVPSLIFDSYYESGNLDMAYQLRDYEYDLYMRVDSNTRGHH